MPGRNIRKEFVPQSFYHVYNRGVEKRTIFLDENDYATFLNLLKRYLSKESSKDKFGRDGVTFFDEVELVAFCLMPNHFHLLIYVKDNADNLTSLLRRVSTSYVDYFNKKYKRVGSLFQGTYKAVRISDDSYLQHISRYIHLNPNKYLTWKYSSLQYYLQRQTAEWIMPQRILVVFEGESYLNFLKDYEEQKELIEELKYELADH
jgi:putative transposase